MRGANLKKGSRNNSGESREQFSIQEYQLITPPIPTEGFLKCPKGHTYQLGFRGEIIGAVVGDLYKEAFHILCVEILPQFRHQGHGQRFIELLEMTVCRLGAQFLQADEVEPDDAPFWLKIGFKPLKAPDNQIIAYRRRIVIPGEAAG